MAKYDFDGRVAFVTGAVRGQGRSQAMRYVEQSGPDNVLSEMIQPGNVSTAFAWLSNDDACSVTGIALPVAAGATAI